jgi:hypothetical protein
MTATLYAAIVKAEQAAREAHDLAYTEEGIGYWTRVSLGRAQSILMHYVVKHAGEYTAPLEARR